MADYDKPAAPGVSYALETFETWYESLSLEEQLPVRRTVLLLETQGVALGYPHSSSINRSAFGGMRELRIQHAGQPYRVLYLFDPKRRAVLLLGGNKIGQDRWYDINVPKADALYREYLAEHEESENE